MCTLVRVRLSHLPTPFDYFCCNKALTVMVNDVSEACGWSKCMQPPSCHSVPQNCETATGNANITVNTGTWSEPLCQTTETLLDFDNGPSVAPPGPMGSVPKWNAYMRLDVVNDSEMQSVSCAIVSQLSMCLLLIYLSVDFYSTIPFA